jgi:hypothetical protein
MVFFLFPDILLALQSVGRLSIGADKSAPIALSPEGLKEIMQLEEVQVALIRQDEVRTQFKVRTIG